MQELPGAFQALASWRQFMLYKLVPSRKQQGKFDKFPVNAINGEVGSVTDSRFYLHAHEALMWAEHYGPGYGVAFVLTEHDPFFFIDIDACAEGNQWSAIACEIMGRFPGVGLEVSQSGRGLHLIGTGTPPPHSCKNRDYNIELYSRERFIALTFNQAQGDASLVFNRELYEFVSQYFPPRSHDLGEEWRTEPVPEWDGPEDDDELLERALRSHSAGSAFDRRASFADLFYGDLDALVNCYPDPEGVRAYDESTVDAALASHLAFWTGRNHERILRLMWRSALVREKWDREDYLPRTITNQCASHSGAVYQQNRKPEALEQQQPSAPPDPPGETVQETIEHRDGEQFMSAQQQVEYFAGCVYIQSMHKVFTPAGNLLNPQQFRATYGGYVFALDLMSESTTRNAFDAFTENQAIKYPIANGQCFRPQEEPGAIIEHEGQRYCNVYVPISTPSKPGDIEPFLHHMRLNLPDYHDREILLAYMAACIQHKGVKFQWAPLLQGVQGNGKTLYTRVVTHALGQRYTHMPRADQIDSQFNGWILNKLFIGIEDVYVPESRQEVLEILKPMITGGDGIEVQYKGVDQITAEVCANFILNSNHKDAIRKTRDDRRFAVFYTAQQSYEDIEAAGMDGDYFPELYDWLKREGYAAVTYYLEHYDIPEELNPATHCNRAPQTSSTEDAIAESMGGIEQEVLEAIEEGRPGFAGGWVSSMALDRLLQHLRAQRQIPPNKRRDLLKSLGYDWHPNLKNGRVNNPVPPDNGKTRLFIRKGHIHANLTQPTEIARKYSDAQMQGGEGPAEQAFGDGA